MKNKLILILLITFNIVGCEKDEYETHKSNGNLITRELQVMEFTSVLAEGKGNVILKQAAIQKVSVTISENILNDINLKVYNVTWEIILKKLKKHQANLLKICSLSCLCSRLKHINPRNLTT